MADYRPSAGETLVLLHGHVVFGLFIVYQLYRFTFTHSMWLVLVTAIDVIVIALTWHEYKYLRSLLHRLN